MLRGNEASGSPLATFVTVDRARDGEREAATSELRTIEKGSPTAAAARPSRRPTDLKQMADPDANREPTRNPDPTLRTANAPAPPKSPSELFGVPAARPYSAKQGIPTVKPMLVQHNPQADSVHALA